MKRRGLGAVVLVAAVVMLACGDGGSLTAEEASALIQALPAYQPGSVQLCTALQTTTRGDGIYLEYPSPTMVACADQLAAGGMLRLGECVEQSRDRCDRRRLEPVNAARASASGLSVLIPCSSVEFGGVDSVTSQGRSASVTYHYSVTRAEMRDYPDCAIQWSSIEPNGRRERARSFTRSDDGRWSID